jgi:gliding motility-associated-like protein
MKLKILTVVLILASKIIDAQNFSNGDLEGVITGTSTLPPSWQVVSYSDINCQADPGGATPDLVSTTQPLVYAGMIGNPYSGNTFVGASHGVGANSGTTFHEGIKQELTGFSIGTEYIITFYQSVVKTSQSLDTSGSWMVVLDNSIIGITVPTISQEPFNSTSFLWESRNISFIASMASHTIKFLPLDDDNNLLSSPTNVNGSLYMGIDSINIKPVLTTGGITLDLGNDTTLCQGETLTLYATTPNASYLWQDNSTNSIFNVTEQGAYWVQITDSTGSVTDTINVSYYQLLTLDLGSDTSLCQGETLTLDATAPNATYLWQDNSSNPTFDVTQQGTYWVTITVNNCSKSDTINLNFNSLPTISFGNDTTLCQGETLTLDATAPNATYLWQDNSFSPTFNVTQQGTYWVETINNCGTISDTINVNFNAISTILVENDTSLCQGETITLDATTPNATYLWQDNSFSPTFDVAQQGTYWVTVTVNNCSKSDTVLIIEEDCEIILEMPNVFTNNNDGINDLFVPKISKGIASMNTIIYNRWGIKIYETNNLLIEWNGEDATDGTYFWIVYYTDKYGVNGSLKGFLTVLK